MPCTCTCPVLIHLLSLLLSIEPSTRLSFNSRFEQAQCITNLGRDLTPCIQQAKSTNKSKEQHCKVKKPRLYKSILFWTHQPDNTSLDTWGGVCANRTRMRVHLIIKLLSMVIWGLQRFQQNTPCRGCVPSLTVSKSRQGRHDHLI